MSKWSRLNLLLNVFGTCDLVSGIYWLSLIRDPKVVFLKVQLWNSTILCKLKLIDRWSINLCSHFSGLGFPIWACLIWWTRGDCLIPRLTEDRCIHYTFKKLILINQIDQALLHFLTFHNFIPNMFLFTITHLVDSVIFRHYSCRQLTHSFFG